MEPLTAIAQRATILSELLRYIRMDPAADLPLSAQLQQQISWLIASGVLRPGDRLPSMRQLAGSLAIHMHTARSAYQKLEQEGLVEIRRGRGTRVLPFDADGVALAAPGFPSFTLGVVIPGFDPFYTPFLQSLQGSLRQEPSLLFVANSQDDPALALRYAQQLIAKGVDGLILASTDLGSHAAALAQATRRPPAIVWVDDPRAERHSVLLDSIGAGEQATRHLLEHGHRRIALITCPIEWANVGECYTGYRRALDSAGVEFEPGLVIEVPSFTLESGSQGVQRLLQDPRPPAAIFATGDLLAIGALQALRQAGKRVPEDVAVVGYTDIQFAALVEPPLTTVAAPAGEMGRRAMAMLRQLRAKQSARPERVVLPTHLVRRRSCGCEPERRRAD